MESEIWKDVVGFEERYEVSNLGRLRSKDMTIHKSDGKIEHKKGRYIKLTPDKRGYVHHVFCSSQGVKKRMSIHRVVAMSFIDNPENKPHIDHINRIRFDNRVENLRWCTLKENMNNPFTLDWLKVCRPNYKHSEQTRKKISEIQKGKTMPEFQKQKLRDKASPVCQYSKDGVFIRHFRSALHASEELNIQRNHILACCRGERQTSGGYRWILKSDYLENENLSPIVRMKRPKRTLTEAQKQRCRMILVGARKKLIRPVVQIDSDGNVLRRFDSITSASNILGLETSSITRCCQGKIKHTKNLYFKYE